jgi:alkylation response protein AidB-like acyl-CoA dehydrogenase
MTPCSGGSQIDFAEGPIGFPYKDNQLSHICRASPREREERPPHDAIELVRRARLGALRVPVAEGGAGASFRQLFTTLIALAEADANVAHILRAHFWFVELRLLGTDPE